MMTTEYDRDLTMLLERIERFRRLELALDDLKSAIWDVARLVSSPDARPLRDALQQAEGQLDMLQHTVSEPDVRVEALKVVDALEARVRAAMSSP